MTHTTPILGVDIGGVLIGPGDTADDTSFFSDHYLRTPQVPGAFDAITRLRDELFGVRIYLVSKCGARVQARSRAWLEPHAFTDHTGIPPERFRFCLERRGKAPICAELGITHFVDDRLEILGSLPETVRKRYLFRGKPEEIEKHAQHLPHVVSVDSWAELVSDLLGA